MRTKRKYLYFGIPISVLSGTLLAVDMVHQNMPENIVNIFMITAIIGIVLCYKSGVYKL